jgi:hypothetical protein
MKEKKTKPNQSRIGSVVLSGGRKHDKNNKEEIKCEA